MIEHATEKRKRKGADWIVANDVSGDVMGGNINAVHITCGEHKPRVNDEQVATCLQHHHIFANFAQAPQRDDPQQGLDIASGLIGDMLIAAFRTLHTTSFLGARGPMPRAL